MADFLMPALGADMETGTLVQWLVAPGARVKSGDVVAVVETHKGAIDCEIFLEGVIEDMVPVGTQLPVGGVLAHVRQAQAAAPTPGVAPSLPQAPAPQPAAPLPAAMHAPSAGEGRVRATPAARRRARELGVDLAQLPGTTAGEGVTLADVERAASPAPAIVPSPARAFDPTAMRQAIAAAMSRSKREIPHYYLGRAIDFDAASRWLADYNATRLPQERLLAAVLLLKATALALARHPQFNGFWSEGAFRPGPAIHVGWAVALRGGGLIAPAIHDADRKPLGQLMHEMRDLVQRVRAGGLRSSEMTDPSVTVTSLGERGADRVLGVIYPPQVALVGFGSVLTRPWVVDGQVAARPVVEASLAADHRASDGHAGSLLLAAIDEALQQPDKL